MRRRGRGSVGFVQGLHFGHEDGSVGAIIVRFRKVKKGSRYGRVRTCQFSVPRATG